MNIHDLKEYIINNDCAEQILEELGCGHIRNHGEYITASNPDGNNISAINLYLNENLTCINHTRSMVHNKKSTDLFDLITFCRDCTFPEALKWTCDLFGLDYYREVAEKPESLQILELLKHMAIGDDSEDNEPLRPISNKILSYFLPHGNKMWEDEGISLHTQRVFSVMYDDQSNRIILPLYDELNNLVGTKGRLMKPRIEDWEQKYLYMSNFNKSKFIFGLNITYKMIKQQGYCPIFESEKSVMIAYEHGIGSVAIGGCKISRYQINALVRLDVPLIICFDKDRTEEDIQNETSKFLEQIPVYYMLDRDDILREKESPVDRWGNWEILKKNNIYKAKELQCHE